jgi:iron(III) transport system substrate-binding protein
VNPSVPANVYNNGLFAAYTAKYGEAKAEEWLRGVRANLAQSRRAATAKPRDVAAGSTWISNAYYWALMMNNIPKRSHGRKRPHHPATFQGGGTHVISRAAAGKARAQQINAVKLIEWLAGERAADADRNCE